MQCIPGMQSLTQKMQVYPQMQITSVYPPRMQIAPSKNAKCTPQECKVYPQECKVYPPRMQITPPKMQIAPPKMCNAPPKGICSRYHYDTNLAPFFLAVKIEGCIQQQESPNSKYSNNLTRGPSLLRKYTTQSLRASNSQSQWAGVVKWLRTVLVTLLVVGYPGTLNAVSHYIYYTSDVYGDFFLYIYIYTPSIKIYCWECNVIK